MRAAVLVDDRGTLDAIEVRELPQPTPGPGQVLVRMRAVPINPSDLNYVRGSYAEHLRDLPWNRARGTLHFDPQGGRPHPVAPFVLGGEGVGDVVGTGGGLLARRLAGRRVALAGSPTGLLAQFAVVDALRVSPLDDAIGDAEGASLFVNPLTAIALVDHVLALPRGATLLQTAASGALAELVRTLAAARGVRTIDLVRSRASADALRARGVPHALCVDEDPLAAIDRLTGGRGVEGAIDCVGGETARLAQRALGRYGTLVLYGTLGGAPMQLEPRSLMMRAGRIEGFFLPHFLDSVSKFTLLRIVRRAAALARRGRYRTKVRATFPLEEVRAAFETATQPGEGKVLVRPDGRP